VAPAAAGAEAALLDGAAALLAGTETLLLAAAGVEAALELEPPPLLPELQAVASSATAASGTVMRAANGRRPKAETFMSILSSALADALGIKLGCC
jgi:hypothetical protein